MICQWRGQATSGSSIEKTDLNQVGLDDLFDRIFFFMNRRGNRAETNRTTVELLNDREQKFPVHFIKAISVDFHSVEGIIRNFPGDAALVVHFRVITDSP